MLEDLLADIGQSFFSLIIDESTMVDAKKVLCLMVRYFSQKEAKICTRFYKLLELESGSAEAMTAAIVGQLQENKLDLAKLIGIGIDGANAMAGQNNSVSSKLTDMNPELVTIKCLCHSLHLCAEKACDKLPRVLDTLVKESHAWFSRSTSRNIKYAKLFEVMCEKRPKKISKLSGTRWLARLDAIETILEQWTELRLHFGDALNERGDAGYKAEVLSKMFEAHENKLYLVFLRHALKKTISVNKAFQSESADPFKLLQDLNELLYQSLQSIVVPQQLEKALNKDLFKFDFKKFLMPAECVNFGYEFNSQSKICKPAELGIIKQRCRDFLIKLCEEIQARVPKNIAVLEKINYFSRENACQGNKLDILDLAVAFGSVCGDIDATINEWNMLHRLNFECGNTEEFWAKVMEMTDANGDAKFQHISKLAVALLCLPFSNASVERAFSMANIVKDKLRNKMSIKTADAIMRVRFSLAEGCVNFVPTPKMLENFDNEHVYKSDFDTEVLDAFNAPTDQ